MYQPCDIRGAAERLSPERYRQWGRTLGGWVKPGDKFVVGGDVRRSTPEFLDALVEGLCQAGVDPINLGILPTPMIYHAKTRLKAAGMGIVSASHGGAGLNGLKWMVGDLPPMPEEVQRLECESQSGRPPDDRTPTVARTLDISFDYVAWLQETWCDATRSHQHVVIDMQHGCWAGRARRYLHAVFPECLISVLHDKPEPEPPAAGPDESHQDRLQALADAVYRQRAHLGIELGGDGDRLALVDNDGIVLTAEETACVMVDTFGQSLRGRNFVYDLKLSDRVREAAEAWGAVPMVERSGHAFLHSRMRQTRAALGAGYTGHYFFDALDGGDDALYAACRVIAHLAGCGKKLSQLRRACPAVFATPELRLPLDGPDQRGLIEAIRAAWPEHPQSVVDGIRVNFPGGWALARPSVTEPVMSFRFESADWHGLEHLVSTFCEPLADIGQRLLECYESAMGTAPRG